LAVETQLGDARHEHAEGKGEDLFSKRRSISGARNSTEAIITRLSSTGLSAGMRSARAR